MLGRRATRSWRARVWLACFAVALNALAPTLTQAAAWVQGRPLGMATHAGAPIGWSARAAAQAHHHHGQDTAPHGGAHGEHCPFCFTHAGSFALAPLPPPAALPIAVPALVETDRADSAAPGAKPRRTAQPRAPPTRA